MTNPDRIKVTRFLTDYMYDYLLGPDWCHNPDDTRSDLLEDKVEIPMLKAICEIMGHEPTMDHCGIPEHDLCVHCSLSMPGKAKR